MRSPSRARHPLAAAAAVALLLVGAPSALAARSTFSGSISPDRGPVGTPLRLRLRFTIDPVGGPNPATLTRVEMWFPPNARVNGHLFPTCSAAAINARQNFSACPKGSLIGRAKGRADTPPVDVYNVPVRFTLFNAPRGGITVHVYAENPILVNRAFEARLIRTRGTYGYRLDARVPVDLQDINYPGGGYWVGLRSFDSTVGITRVVRGKRRGYIESTTLCPKSGRVPIRAKFTFLRGHAPSTSSGAIRCRR